MDGGCCLLDADQLAKNTSAAALYYFRGYDYDDLEKTVCYSSVSVVVARFGHLFGVISLVSTCFFFQSHARWVNETDVSRAFENALPSMTRRGLGIGRARMPYSGRRRRPAVAVATRRPPPPPTLSFPRGVSCVRSIRD